jgi:hypothetical protein
VRFWLILYRTYATEEENKCKIVKKLLDEKIDFYAKNIKYNRNCVTITLLLCRLIDQIAEHCRLEPEFSIFVKKTTNKALVIFVAGYRTENLK